MISCGIDAWPRINPPLSPVPLPPLPPQPPPPNPTLTTPPPPPSPPTEGEAPSATDTAGPSPDNILDDDAAWAEALRVGKLTKGDKLADLLQMRPDTFPPFRRNFYIPPPEVANMSKVRGGMWVCVDVMCK